MKPKRERIAGKKMIETMRDSNVDYRFLRSNEIHAKTALRMLALAYMGKKGVE